MEDATSRPGACLAPHGPSSSASSPMVPPSMWSPRSPREASRDSAGSSVPGTPRNKIPRASPSESLHLAIRLAVRAEMGELLAENGHFRQMLRSELASSLRSAPSTAMNCNGEYALGEVAAARDVTSGHAEEHALAKSHKVGTSTSVIWDVEADDDIVEHDKDDDSREEDEEEFAVAGAKNKHFKKLLRSVTIARHRSLKPTPVDQADQEVPCVGAIVSKLDALYLRLMRMEEPERAGLLAGIVTSTFFEALVCFIISVNCAFLVYEAESLITNPAQEIPWTYAGDWFFQIFYSIELLLRLAVHRKYFFLNEGWRLNWFDFTLVLLGYFDLVILHTSSSGTFLRILRITKIGKAMRAVKILAHFSQLNAFLICIQGSATSFVWSVVMLCCVFFLFSLLFLQLTAAHLVETGQALDGTLESYFGSVFESMMTLYMASTGGVDWGEVYDVITQVGVTGSVLFIIFTAFVQLALINIITGIFVESAMENLAPNRETVAVAHARQEVENVRDLEHLCKLVDTEGSGKLTPHQFEEGMRKGRIPTLLTLLGLDRRSVLKFFKTMSDLSVDDGGRVDIEQFVEGCMRLKGTATNFDLQLLHSDVKDIQLAQERKLNRICRDLRTLRGSAR